MMESILNGTDEVEFSEHKWSGHPEQLYKYSMIIMDIPLTWDNGLVLYSNKAKR